MSSAQSPRRQSRTASKSTSFDLKLAGTVGAIVFVIGLVLVGGILLADIGDSDDPDDQIGEDDEDDLSVLDMISIYSWPFYTAHFVDIEADTFLGPISVDMGDLSEDGSLPTAIYHIIPVGLLLAGGYFLARRTLESHETMETGAKHGASIAAGYFPLTIFGGILFEVELEEGVTAGPDLAAAILIMGIVFPVVMGAIGGAVAMRE